MSNQPQAHVADELLAGQVIAWRKEVARLNDLIAHAVGTHVADERAAEQDRFKAFGMAHHGWPESRYEKTMNRNGAYEFKHIGVRCDFEIWLEAKTDARIAAGAPAETAKPVAPWPDFNGALISHGARLVHPDGSTFVAIRLDGYDEESDAWRAVYDHEPQMASRLCLQIGDKGQAVLSGAAQPAPAPATNARDAVLDFFDTHSLHVQTCYSEGSSVPVYEVCIVHGAIEDDSLQCMGTGSTLRAAIDAARAAMLSANSPREAG